VKMTMADPKLVERAKAIRAAAQRFPGGLKLMFDILCEHGRRVEVDSGIAGVVPSAEFLSALEGLVRPSDYSLTVVSDCLLEKPDRPWER